MKAPNSTGPNIDPWGAPFVTSVHRDIELTTTLWVWLSNQFLVHWTVQPSNPSLCNLERRMLWKTVSKALQKSIQMTSIAFPLFPVQSFYHRRPLGWSDRTMIFFVRNVAARSTITKILRVLLAQENCRQLSFISLEISLVMNTQKEEWELVASSKRVVKPLTTFIPSLLFQSLFHVVLGFESKSISSTGFKETDRKSWVTIKWISCREDNRDLIQQIPGFYLELISRSSLVLISEKARNC